MIILAVLASGRGSNLGAIIEQCRAGAVSARVGVVISDQAGAGALDRARAAGIPAVCLPRGGFCSDEHELAMVRVLEQHEVELIALAGYMRLVGPVLLSRFAGRILNIHPSLLPAFPGVDAQRQAVDYGVKVSGCTVHFVDKGMDTGPIILQQAVTVRDDDTADSLAARILKVEHELYPRAIDLVARGALEVRGRTVRRREPR